MLLHRVTDVDCDWPGVSAVLTVDSMLSCARACALDPTCMKCGVSPNIRADSSSRWCALRSWSVKDGLEIKPYNITEWFTI